MIINVFSNIFETWLEYSLGRKYLGQIRSWVSQLIIYSYNSQKNDFDIMAHHMVESTDLKSGSSPNFCGGELILCSLKHSITHCMDGGY